MVFASFKLALEDLKSDESGENDDKIEIAKAQNYKAEEVKEDPDDVKSEENEDGEEEEKIQDSKNSGENEEEKEEENEGNYR